VTYRNVLRGEEERGGNPRGGGGETLGTKGRYIAATRETGMLVATKIEKNIDKDKKKKGKRDREERVSRFQFPRIRTENFRVGFGGPTSRKLDWRKKKNRGKRKDEKHWNLGRLGI